MDRPTDRQTYRQCVLIASLRRDLKLEKVVKQAKNFKIKIKTNRKGRYGRKKKAQCKDVAEITRVFAFSFIW